MSFFIDINLVFYFTLLFINAQEVMEGKITTFYLQSKVASLEKRDADELNA